MAAKRRRNRDGGASPPPPAEAPPQAAEAPEEAPAAPAAPGPLARAALPGAALLALAGALLASPPEGAVTFPGLWLAARVLGAAAAALGLAGWRASGRAAPWALGGAVVAAAAALMAALHRDPAWHLSPFEVAHPALAGFPAGLAFAALAAGAAALLRRPRGALPWAVLVTAALAALALLLMPHYRLGEARAPLALALGALDGAADLPAGRLAGAVLILLVAPLGAAVALLVRRARPRPLPWSRPDALAAAAAAPLLAAHHLAAPLAAGGGLGQLGAGALSAGLLLLVAAAGARLAADLDEAPLPDADARAAGRLADVAVPALVLVAYGLLKTHGMVPSNTDENIYFYMAQDLSRGRWPYVDYFFAHPPLHVLLPGAVLTVTGWSFTLAKTFSVLAGGVTALAVWLLSRRHLGRVAAAFAMVAVVFAAEFLKATTNMTGINLTVMWLTLGLWQALGAHPLRAGAMFGLAACTGFYSMGAICAVLALTFFRDVRSALRQLAAFAAVFGAINLAFLVAAGDAFVDGVYRYHGLKAYQDPRMVPLSGGDRTALAALLHNVKVMATGDPFTKEIYYHAHLWLAGLLAPLAGALGYFLDPERRARPARFFDPRRFWRDGADGAAALVWCVALALFVQYSMFRELYSFYFTLIYPVLAVLLGYLVSRALALAWSAVRAASPPAALPAARLGAATALLALFALWEPWAARANHVFPDEFQQLGKRNPYEWTPAPVLAGLSDVTRALWWEDFRLKGDMERGYRHYLWTKKRGFATLDEIAAWVAERTEPDETIAGSSTAAPLVALAAGRRLAAGEADTNNKRFKTGLLDEEAYWDAVCADRVRFLVSTSRSYFTPQKLARFPTTRRWFAAAKVFQDPQLSYGRPYPITIYERRGEPPGEGRVCRWEPR